LKILKDKDMAKLKCRADFGGIILLDSTSAKKKRGPVHKDGNLHCSDQSFEQRFLDGRFEKSFFANEQEFRLRAYPEQEL